MSNSFSVIIRVKNEERWVGHAIQSSLDFLHGPQIVVVDNKSTDESIDIVRSFRHDPALEVNKKRYADVIITSISDYTPGKALNTGVQNCIFENILILSAHCVITQLPDVKLLLSLINDYGCVFGKQVPVYRGRKITPRYLWSHFGDAKTENMMSQLENRYFIHNAFCFYKKQVLLDHPFDEDISGKEDRIWAAAYAANGKHYYYHPELVAHHHYTDKGNTWKGVG